MNNTTNYNYKLPEESDFAKISDINDNFTQLDGQLKSMNDTESAHEEKKITSSNGVHGLRFLSDKLEYKEDDTWNEIKTGGGGSIINVTTIDPEFYGQTVTLTDGNTSLTGTMGNNGVCTFEGVQLTGTLTASISYDGDVYTNTVSVTYFGVYSVAVTLGEAFTLNISTTESTLYEQSITITNGTKTKTAAFDASGDCTAVIHFSGTVTITSTDGDQTATTTISVVPGTSTYTVALSFVKIYGVQWDGTSTTSWSRTDDAADFVNPVPALNGGNGSSPFDDLYPWSGMVVEERTGGTMVKIPKFWYKITKSGYSLKIQIADKAKDGFSVSPAHMNRGDGKGVRDYVYVGRYHSASDGKSKTGVKPYANITRSEARTALHNVGTNYWQIDFATRFTIWLLYLVEMAGWNSQNDIGYGCGNNSAAENMGYTDNMTYHTGTTQSSRTSYGLGEQYRHIEGLWDNVYDWLDGCYYDANGLNIILNPSSFSDSTGGTLVGLPTGGYPSKFDVSDNAGFPMFYPIESSGSDSTYSCDDWDFDASGPCLCAGGAYYQSLNLGLFFVYCSSASSKSAYRGCRLLELP